MPPITIKTPQYTTAERVYLLELKMGHNSHRVLKHNYKKRFPFSGRSPSKMTVWKQTKKFTSKGTVLNLNKGNSGRKKSVLTDDNLALMRDLFQSEKDLPARQSRSSCRRHNLPIQISKSSFQRSSKQLGFHPYKLHRRHTLKAGDKIRRVAMAQYVLNKHGTDPDWLNNVWMSDEAVFSLNGNVNSKNVVCYSEKREGRPENFTIDTTKHAGSVMPWACLAGDGRKLQLKFFEPEMVDGEKVGTMNGDRYYKLMRYRAIPQIKALNQGSLDGQTWQQDGARPHWSQKNLTYIQGQFGTNTLALGAARWGGAEWAPHSPDLSVLDFCVWGIMKYHVFQHPMPTTKQALKEKISAVWEREITPDLAKKAFAGFVSRCRKVLLKDGGHQDNE
jgi:hypothetical protein